MQNYSQTLIHSTKEISTYPKGKSKSLKSNPSVVLFRNKRKIKADVEEWLHVSAHHEAIFFRAEYTVEMRHMKNLRYSIHSATYTLSEGG